MTAKARPATGLSYEQDRTYGLIIDNDGDPQSLERIAQDLSASGFSGVIFPDVDSLPMSVRKNLAIGKTAGGSFLYAIGRWALPSQTQSNRYLNFRIVTATDLDTASNAYALLGGAVAIGAIVAAWRFLTR